MDMLPGNLNLFTRQPVQLGTSEVFYDEIPTSTVLDGSTPVINFLANPDKGSYTNLYESFLMLKTKYVKGDGTNLPAKPTIGPIQCPLTSIFKRMTLYLNDKRVSPVEDQMPYVNFLRMFAMHEGTQKSVLSMAGWYNDTYASAAAPLFTTANQAAPQAGVSPNVGLQDRANLYGESREVVLIGRIFLPLHTCKRLLPPGVKLAWKFEMAPMKFFSMCAEDNPNYHFYVTDAAILLQREKVQPSLLLEQQEILNDMENSNNMIYPCTRVSTKTKNVSQGSFSMKFENVFTGKEMPVAVFLVFVKSTALNGNFKENPFVFLGLGATEVVCKLGSKKIPNVDIDLNFNQHQTQFALFQSMKAMGLLNDTGTANFNRSTFDYGLALFGFALSRDGTASTEYGNSSFDASNVTIDVTFAEATAVEMTGILHYI